MKKNKLFKTLGCLAGISAIGAIIPTITTSCGSSEKINPIPEEAYAIDGNGVLTGWAKDWDAERVEEEGYDTMVVPKDVTKIGESAFINESGEIRFPALNVILDSNLKTIGSRAFYAAPIISIDFSSCKNLESINAYAFNGSQYGECGYSTLKTIDLSSCTSLTSIGECSFINYIYLSRVVFPKSLINIGSEVLFSQFYDIVESREFDIVWKGLDSAPTGGEIQGDAFYLDLMLDFGKVKSIGGKYSSKDLFEFLKSKGLPMTGTWSAD